MAETNSRPEKGQSATPVSVHDEYSKLVSVIIGLGSPYQPDKAQVAGEMHEFPFLPDTARRAEVLALTYPTEIILKREYANFVAVLEKYGVEVLYADASAAYSFDYTCPRDIGFVIGNVFFIANMSVTSRAEEYLTILHHLKYVDSEKLIHTPGDAVFEGGDVIFLDQDTILIGINQRTNFKGYKFLAECLQSSGLKTVPVRHSQLHLDCCLNPLGNGHLLIHPESLEGNTEDTWQVLKQKEWIKVDSTEREHLATNVLSIDQTTVIARDNAHCARVNRQLADRGYTVEAVEFDAVPATGGSFRCASLVLTRQ